MADEVELGDERVDKLLCVVAPTILAINHWPAGVGVLGPRPSVILVNVRPVDLVHRTPAVQPQVAILFLQGRPQVKSLSPVKLGGDLV